jgi:transposase InsO family protein
MIRMKPPLIPRDTCRPRASGKRVSLAYHRWLTKTTEEEAQTHGEDTTRASDWRSEPKSFGSRQTLLTYFTHRAAGIGIRPIVTPIRVPNANPVAERVIGTLRRECLDHLIVLHECHLLNVLHEYVG